MLPTVISIVSDLFWKFHKDPVWCLFRNVAFRHTPCHPKTPIFVTRWWYGTPSKCSIFFLVGICDLLWIYREIRFCVSRDSQAGRHANRSTAERSKSTRLKTTFAIHENFITANNFLCEIGFEIINNPATRRKPNNTVKTCSHEWLVDNTDRQAEKTTRMKTTFAIH